MITTRDIQLARKAKKCGANYSLRIIWEARRAGIPISLGFALIEKESDFQNVFGCDPTDSIPPEWKNKPVTRKRYNYYKAHRFQYGFQGVGPAQLTYYTYQDRADAYGGCHKPAYNIRVGFQVLASLIRQSGLTVEAFARYNGSGPAAQTYGEDLQRRQRIWHQRLVP